jgi:hypothetical protein
MATIILLSGVALLVSQRFCPRHLFDRAEGLYHFRFVHLLRKFSDAFTGDRSLTVAAPTRTFDPDANMLEFAKEPQVRAATVRSGCPGIRY